MIVVANHRILAAIAIPNFIKFQARSKRRGRGKPQGRLPRRKRRSSRRGPLLVADGEVGFEPQRNNRYLLLAASGTIEDRNQLGHHPATTYTGIQVDVFKYGAPFVQTYSATACSSVPGIAPRRPRASWPPRRQHRATDDDQWSISEQLGVFTADTMHRRHDNPSRAGERPE